MALHQLVYCSTAVSLFSREELMALARDAARQNADIGITGELFYCGGTFMQMLEGEGEVVRSLFERIAQDERHTFVELVFEGGCGERTFARWSMGLCVVDPDFALPQHEFLAVSRFFKHCDRLDSHVVSRALKARFEEMAAGAA